MVVKELAAIAFARATDYVEIRSNGVCSAVVIKPTTNLSDQQIRAIAGIKEGAMCGYSKDCNNMALSQVPVVTKVKNLLLTGQNCNIHGFCGVPLTAINTCEAILGRNYVIESIHRYENSRKQV